MNKKCFAVACFVSMFSACAKAGVYDDTLLWLHLDYDPDFEPGALNVAVPADIRNQKDWSNTSLCPASMTGEYGGPLWTNATVVCPAGGQSYGRHALLFPQVVTGEGLKPDTFTYPNINCGLRVHCHPLLLGRPGVPNRPAGLDIQQFV